MVSIEEALNIISGSIRQLKPISVPLSRALGCRLAADINASINHPPFPRSPLDGYAVRAEDILNAKEAVPACLKVVGRSYAGLPSSAQVSQGEAVLIMTGGVIPQGADCVVRQEDTDFGADVVRIYAHVTGRDNICPAGEVFKEGVVLVSEGAIIHAATIAVAAAAGYREVTVVPIIKAAILTTGDEVRAPGQTLAHGQIYDSNSPYIAARLAELNISLEKQASCSDRIEDTKEKLNELLRIADVVITTGGVSVGERDIVPEAIRTIGGELMFHGVAMKPGMPTLFALVNGKPILSLSGNPYSAAVAFELFGRAIFGGLSGNDEMLPAALEGILQNEYGKTGNVVRYVHGELKNGYVTVSNEQGNAQLCEFAKSNCLAEIQPEEAPLKHGDHVRILRIR